MRRLVSTLLIAVIGFAVAGCAGAGGEQAQTTTSNSQKARSGTKVGTPHPVRVVQLPVHQKLRGHGAGFLSPTRLAFYTAGSSNCRPVPISLSVETPDSIRVRLKEQKPPNGICLADLIIEPVVIAIDPKQINVHRRLTIHLHFPLTKQPTVFTALPLT